MANLSNTQKCLSFAQVTLLALILATTSALDDVCKKIAILPFVELFRALIYNPKRCWILKRCGYGGPTKPEYGRWSPNFNYW